MTWFTKRTPVPTASQTAGPFFHVGLSYLCHDQILTPGVGDAAVTVSGRVLDGVGAPVNDVAIEIWQAAPDGTYDRVGRHGFGRCCPDDDGNYAFTTVRPGAASSLQAPHLVVMFFMRGLLKHLVTRLYFPDDPSNDVDSVLALVPDERRHTLIARTTSEPNALRWDIILQGDGETVFFDVLH